jgi:hypothetical protein
MKTYRYFLILFFLDTSIYVSSAASQSSQPLLAPTQFLFESSFTTRNSRTNQQLRPHQGITLDKIVAAVIQRTNQTQITMRSDTTPRVRQLRVKLENL